MTTWELVTADILNWAASYNGPKFHALLCDPPYELKFMNKKWDASGVSFQPETWVALAEHLHPGAFGMAFASSRGWHRLAVAIEDAGMVIQPSIFGWANGQSFPKATRIDTIIDRRAGKLGERKVVGRRDTRSRYDGADRQEGVKFTGIWNGGEIGGSNTVCITTPATDLARAWVGHRYGGQILKNALEPIIVFQKPWQGKRLDCIVETGAGAMWIDGSRVNVGQQWWERGDAPDDEITAMMKDTKGRWPSNFTLTHHPDCQRVGTQRVKGTGTAVHRHGTKGTWGTIGTFKPGSSDATYADPDGYETIPAWDCVPECPVRRLGEMSGERPGPGSFNDGSKAKGGKLWPMSKRSCSQYPKEQGTAARFYFQTDWSYEIAERLAMADPVCYAPKASRKERENGLLGVIPCIQCGNLDSETHVNDKGKIVPCRRCGHPTVKPIALTRWLATLLLPPPEYAPRRMVIPFSGTSSEGIGAGLAGWEEMVLIDMLAENNEIAEARLSHWLNKRQLELL